MLLGLAFVLSAVIGLEREFQQKAAGLRTHVLVGSGAALFTLVSAFGFEYILGGNVTLDPSRIAAQIVSGIGFLGGGVIFMRRDIVRGLTTAATIWMTAAIGMACGAGMPLLAIAATAMHLIAVTLLSPLTRRLPSRDRRRIVLLRYDDGQGVLRSILATATNLGFEASVLGTDTERDEHGPYVRASMRFRGKAPLRALVAELAQLEGVRAVRTRAAVDD